MLVKRILFLLSMGFLFRVLTSCIGLWGGEPQDVYFDWASLTVESLDVYKLFTSVSEVDTMASNAISFRLTLHRDLDSEQYAYVSSLWSFSCLQAFSIAYNDVPNQTVDSIAVVALLDLSSAHLAHSEVSSLFVSEEAGWNYDLYEPLEGMQTPSVDIHLKPRFSDLDSVCFVVSVFLSDHRVLCDTTNVITIIDPVL